jgi:LysR family transcriptional regulator, nitrogen assimilation regulatory protein
VLYIPRGIVLNLRQLKYFIRIVDLGSLSRAAEALHIAQSALSHQMSQLEASLEAELLTRTSKGVAPTEAGKRIYKHAQTILKQIEDAKLSVKADDDHSTHSVSGVVSIGLPLSFVQSYALPIYLDVQRCYPKITLQIHETLSGTALEWVKNGRLNIGIAFDEENLDGLSATPIVEEELFLMVNSISPLTAKNSITLQELSDIPLVLPSIDQGVRSQVERALNAYGDCSTIIGLQANSLTLMKQATVEGLAGTVLAWASAQSEISSGLLHAIQITHPKLSRVAALCVSATLPQSVASKCVLRVVADAIRQTVLKADWPGVRVL